MRRRHPTQTTARLPLYLMIPVLAAAPAAGAPVLEPPAAPLFHDAFFSVLEDLNGDTHPDLVGVVRPAGPLVFLAGDGAGGFGGAWLAGVGESPFAAVAADLDGDGNLDLAVSNATDVSILLGHGDGTFAPEYRVAHGGQIGRFPAAADLDDDGQVDLVVALRGAPYVVAILLGKGDGTFEPAVHLPSVTRPRIPVVDDLNGDGIPDLAVAAETSGELAVHLGVGDGTFQPAWFTALPGGGVPDMVAADLDGDGDIDLAVGDTFNEAAQILTGNGDGTFLVSDRIILGENAAVRGLGLGDFDGDGHDDLVAARDALGSDDDRVFLLSGSGIGSFVAEESVPLAQTALEHILVGDVNSDGFSDAVLSQGGILIVSSAPEPGSCADADGDGFGIPGDPACPGGGATDCDDGDGARSPGVPEVCDGMDNDCDGLADEVRLCNDPPEAIVSSALEAECEGPDGARVTLVGSASSDPDSTPGTNDDIIRFAWFENYGLPGQIALAGGQTNSVLLEPGAHSLTLVVTDSWLVQDVHSFVVTVLDTTGPELTVLASPAELWPPNHRMVDVGVALGAVDLCDPSPPSIALVAASSSEPDNATGLGDGDTEGDIEGDDPGTPDTALRLRAERAAGGSGRIYELLYQATDASGNVTSAVAAVTVPQDRGSGPDPLALTVAPEESGAVRVLWTAVPEAAGYDVIAGDLSALRRTGQVTSLGFVRVLAANTAATSVVDEGADEARAALYLVQYRTAMGGTGYGSESAPWPREPASCGGGCP